MLHEETCEIAVQDRGSRAWEVHQEVRENRRGREGLHWEVCHMSYLSIFLLFY